MANFHNFPCFVISRFDHFTLQKIVCRAFKYQINNYTTPILGENKQVTTRQSMRQ